MKSKKVKKNKTKPLNIKNTEMQTNQHAESS